MSRKAVIFWIVFLIGVVADQATKLWVMSNLAEGVDSIVVIPGLFDIVHAENPGAAFSLFRDWEYRYLLFLGFTCVAVWIVWDQFRRITDDDRWMSFALGLIASGAIGNAIDRITKRTVTDFLRVYTEQEGLKGWLIETFGTYEWPSFNVADSTLFVGVVIYLIAGRDLESEPAAPAAATDDADTPTTPDPAITKPDDEDTDDGAAETPSAAGGTP